MRSEGDGKHHPFVYILAWSQTDLLLCLIWSKICKRIFPNCVLGIINHHQPRRRTQSQYLALISHSLIHLLKLSARVYILIIHLTTRRPTITRRQSLRASLQCRHLCPCHFKHVLSQMLHPIHLRHLHALLPNGSCSRKRLPNDELEFIGTLEEAVKSRSQLVAGLENVAAAEDIEAKARARHGHGETAQVAEVANTRCAHEGEDDVCGGVLA